MDTFIYFEDILGGSITDQQVANSAEYVRVTSIYGLVKKKEEYVNHILKYVIYYLDNNESAVDILSLYSDVPIIDIRTRSQIGEYTVEDTNGYYDGLLDYKYKEVINAKNQLIYSSPIDAITNEHDYVETTKYFFDSTTGKKFYTFWYGDNGSISTMDSLNPIHRSYINEFKQAFTPDELSDLEGLSWKDMIYYHNANPIIPE